MELQNRLNDSHLVAIIILISILFHIALIPINTDLATGLRQGTVTATVVVLTILSYRYTVKSHLHSTVGEVEPMKIDNYLIKPTVIGVKWRPNWYPFEERSTSIKFHIYYEDEGDSYLTDGRVLYEEYHINPAEFQPIEDVWVCENEENEFEDVKFRQNLPSPDAQLSGPPNLHCPGLHFTYESTNPKDVRIVVDRLMRRLKCEMKQECSDRKTGNTAA